MISNLLKQFDIDAKAIKYIFFELYTHVLHSCSDSVVTQFFFMMEGNILIGTSLGKKNHHLKNLKRIQLNTAIIEPSEFHTTQTVFYYI